MIGDRTSLSSTYALSPAQKLLLQATLLEKELALTAWERWQSLIDIEELDAASYALLPLLYKNLLAHGVEHPYMARLKGIYRRTWYANQLQLKSLQALLLNIKANQIEAVVLDKAFFCGYQFGNHYALDCFHLLIHDEKLEAATQLLMQLNWQVVGASTNSFIHLQNHQQFSLYLQSHLFWGRVYTNETDEQVWHYATLDGWDSLGWRLSVIDQFLDSCVRTFWKSRSPQLHGIVDTMMLMREFGHELDWMKLVERAQGQHVILPLRNMLTLVQEVLPHSIPNWLLPLLWRIPITQTEWQNYQVLAGDQRAWLQLNLAQSLHSCSYLATKLQQLRQLPFPGRQTLKHLLKQTESAFK